MTYRQGRLAIAVVLCALTAGCATPSNFESARRFEASGHSCVQSIATIAPRPIPFIGPDDKSTKVEAIEFNEIAACVRAADGMPVPVALFRVDNTPPLQIEIDVISDRNAVFAPRVDLLGADFQLIRSIPFSEFERRGSRFSTEFFLNNEDAGVKLIALVPDATSVGREDRSTVGASFTNTVAIPVAGGSIFWSYTTGDESLTSSWLSEIGPFMIVARPDPTQTR